MTAFKEFLAVTGIFATVYGLAALWNGWMG